MLALQRKHPTHSYTCQAHVLTNNQLGTSSLRHAQHCESRSVSHLKLSLVPCGCWPIVVQGRPLETLGMYFLYVSFGLRITVILRVACQNVDNARMLKCKFSKRGPNSYVSLTEGGRGRRHTYSTWCNYHCRQNNMRTMLPKAKEQSEARKT